MAITRATILAGLLLSEKDILTSLEKEGRRQKGKTGERRKKDNGKRRREEFRTLGKRLPMKLTKTQTERRKPDSRRCEWQLSLVLCVLAIDKKAGRGKNAKRWEGG